MKKFMVVAMLDGDPHAKFFDKLTDAERYRMDAECGVGARVQVYEWRADKDGIEGYSFMYE